MASNGPGAQAEAKVAFPLVLSSAFVKPVEHGSLGDTGRALSLMKRSRTETAGSTDAVTRWPEATSGKGQHGDLAGGDG